MFRTFTLPVRSVSSTATAMLPPRIDYFSWRCKRTALGRVAEIYGPDFPDYDKVTRRDGYTLRR